MSDKLNKVVLAYSGGLDTSVILHWLMERYGCEVIAFCADLGQGEEINEAKENAQKIGASGVYIEDLRDVFLTEFIYPMFRAGAIYENSYLLGTSIARPLIARTQIQIVEKEGADAVAHGATGKGNDQIRFELTYYRFNPSIRVIAPWREWEFNGRADLIKYARDKGIPINITPERPYSIDRNILHISYEGGILEDPWNEPPSDMFLLTNSPEEAPDEPEYVEIDFKGGDPVGVNNVICKPVELWEVLNRYGASHGIGRSDVVENRFVGLKSRGVYECPAGEIVYTAHRAMESITLDREVMHLRDSLIPKYSEMVYYGYWFSPEREMIQAAIDECQCVVNGTVRLRLYKGNCQVVGRKSDNSLYSPELSSFDKEGGYIQSDATGFININALRLKIRAMVEKKLKITKNI